VAPALSKSIKGEAIRRARGHTRKPRSQQERCRWPPGHCSSWKWNRLKTAISHGVVFQVARELYESAEARIGISRSGGPRGSELVDRALEFLEFGIHFRQTLTGREPGVG